LIILVKSPQEDDARLLGAIRGRWIENKAERETRA
jgi:hypothetical protein